MTMHYFGLALVNNISRFLKCINYKQENYLQPCFIFQLSLTSFGDLNFVKTLIIRGVKKIIVNPIIADKIYR